MTRSNEPIPWRRARRTSCRRTEACSPSLVRWRFCSIALTAWGAESRNNALPAPRERASIPMAPVPANRSSTRAPSTRAPRLEKRPSRARSETGRVPAGTGASRVPLAVPATILTSSGRARSRVEQPLDGLARERLAKELQQFRTSIQSRVCVDDGERPGPGPPDQLGIVGQPGQLQVGQAGLLDVEQCALASKPEVLIGQLEAVGGPNHRGQTCPGVIVVRTALVEQHAMGPVAPPADPAAELMELRQAEALGVLHQ